MQSHIETQSPSGVTAVNFNDVFSATYDAYKIVMNIKTASNVGVNMRLRAAGVDNSSAIYSIINGRNRSNNTSLIIAAQGESETSGSLAEVENKPSIIEVNLTNPFATDDTSAFFHNNFQKALTPFSTYYFGGWTHRSASSFDGFTVLAGANITGTISVYGYGKS